MKRFIASLMMVMGLMAGCGESSAAVLGITDKGTVISQASLAACRTAAGIKTCRVTTPQVITTALVWPEDRALEFTPGAYVTFTGSGALTGLKGNIRPEWFGVNTTPGTTDMSPAIQKAVDAAIDGQSTLYLTGVYGIGGTTKVRKKINFSTAGKDVEFRALASFVGNYAFTLNVNDAETSWVEAFPGTYGDIEGIYFNGANKTDIKWFLIGAPITFHENYGRYMAQFAKSVNVFLDQIVVDRLEINECRGANYCLDFNNQGDARLFNEVHITSSDKALSSYRSLTGKATNCIFNADVVVGSVQNFVFDTVYMEGATAKVTAGPGSVTFLNCNFLPQVDEFITGVDGTSTTQSLISFINTNFRFITENQLYSGYDGQIKLFSMNYGRVRWSFKDTYVVYSASADQTKTQITGLVSDLAAFNNISQLASTQSTVLQKGVKGLGSINLLIGGGSGGDPGVSAATSDSSIPWRLGVAATYYYKGNAMWDNTRMIGYNTGMRTVAVTTNGVRLDLNLSTANYHEYLLRIYRGTTSATYSHYVDVPINKVAYLYDDGYSINGIYNWKVYNGGTPAASEGLNHFGVSSIEFAGANIIAYMSGMPTTGTWTRGDMVVNNAPATGAAKGWRRVTTGAGNVLNTDWVSEGNL
ncbi:MAG: hypothetical protein A2Y38_16230 [Spirochaetes bacterium GWB1_59_5]|nr:MAG: hypothetical protein A2Y38_16230 [Spirochaetes bacterium GWB1_59_5]